MQESKSFFMRPDREALKKLALYTQVKLGIMGFAAVFSLLVGIGLVWPIRISTFSVGDWLIFLFILIMEAFFIGGGIYVYNKARHNWDGGLIIVYAGEITKLELESDTESPTYRVHFGAKLSCVVDAYVHRQCEIGKTMAIRLWQRDGDRLDFSEDASQIRTWVAQALPADAHEPR